MNKVETLLILGMALQSFYTKEVEEFQEYVGQEFLDKLGEALENAEEAIEVTVDRDIYELFKNLVEKNVFQED